MIRCLKFLMVAGLAMLLLPATDARAQHAGDVEFAYESGEIVIENGERGRLDARIYFAGTFGVGGPLDRYTDDPGFESHDPIGAGDRIDFEVLLSRFGTFLTVFDPLSNSVLGAHPYPLNVYKGASSVNVTAASGGIGLVGFARGSGMFHEHINFQLSGSAPAGAYGLLMRLKTDAAGIADSEPFWLIFNYDLSPGVFEQGVRAITGIPEPSGLALLGLFGAAGLARYRRRVCSAKAENIQIADALVKR
ncbi:MAG TPA: hypothetical protein PKD54_07180 [Pirellulaceae bacterium]|nr:hypothetical protein [Pirellulaceae bacterium]